MTKHEALQPNLEQIHFWELYEEDLMVEYTQSVEEGLDVAHLEELMKAVSKLPRSPHKQELGTTIFHMISEAKQREGYPYNEPSDLESIRALRKAHEFSAVIPTKEQLKEKIRGAWLGRTVGCLLGKPVEGFMTEDLLPVLKNSENYPMHRYINAADMPQHLYEKYPYPLSSKPFGDLVDGMPVDDDTNYTVLSQLLIEKYGREFTPYDLSRLWLDTQRKDAYCTAERVAYKNFVNGFVPTQSAVYKNPYREWIGAQIRGDYFGYINPGNAELAAEMAFRDASISHIKNGIYGEMWAAAMIACAAVTENIKDIILGGLAQIPQGSRLYEAISGVLTDWENGMTQEACFAKIHQTYDEHSTHDWCHTISNAVIVAAVLLYGEGDFSRSICMAVETGFDTDCNGATVGSILGMRNGASTIDEQWLKPLNDTIHTSIFGVGTVKISDLVEKTMKQL